MLENNCFRTMLKLLKIIKMFYSNSNKFRYWLHKKIGIEFKPRALEFPRMVIAETSSHCNLSCIHCCRTYFVENGNFIESFMDFDLYKKIIDEMSQYKYTTLRPMGFGEALINPEFTRMIRYAKEKGINEIWLNTNGTLLSPKMSRELLGAGIDRIEVSIDAATPEMFFKIKGKDQYDKVVKNTIECCRLKKELCLKTEIVVSFVESEINTSEKNAFIKFWNNHADIVNIRPVHQYGSLIKNLRTHKNKKEEERFPCRMLWDVVLIDYNGSLRYCCLDGENRSVIGNVKNSSIKEIWNSEGYKQLRTLHIDKRFSEIPLCNVCKSYYEAGHWR